MTTITRRWALISVVTIGLLIAALSIPIFQFCDGGGPGWVENRGGCASWSPIEYLYQWHWGIEDQCLGLCENSLEPG